MPTFEKSTQFLAEYLALPAEQRALVRRALGEFITDLRHWEEAGMPGRPAFRARLRIKDVEGRKGVWEMTWAWPDGRATFQYGAPIPGRVDRVHIMWRRIGTHRILRDP